MKKRSIKNLESKPKRSSSNNSSLSYLNKRRDDAQLGGGPERQEAQVKKGKMLARERLSLLFDNGEFEEIDPFVRHSSNDFGLDNSRIDGDSVVCGYGNIMGKQVFSYSQDFTVLGGSLSKAASNFFNGFPLSKLSAFANSSKLFSIKFAILSKN